MSYVMTSAEFIEKLNLALANKTLYANGAFGAPAGWGNNRDRYSRDKSAARARKIQQASDDTFLFDCVCLVKGILWDWCADTGAQYGGARYASNGVPDATINSIVSYCSDYSNYLWDNVAVGEFLHLGGEHCGVYIGDGLAIECTPSWSDGVQITAVANIGNKPGYNSRVWTGHGKLPWIDYSQQPTPPGPEPKPQRVSEDGWWGRETTYALQDIFGCTSLDAVVSRQPNSNRKYLANASVSSWEFKGWPFYLGGSAVIRAMQGWLGITQDGYAGYEFVGALQQCLKDLGYYTGLIDHSAGPGTVTALQRWINAQ